MATRVVIIDTHVSLFPEREIRFEDSSYWGASYREHSPSASEEEKAKRLWASIDNESSFWFTRPSLVNLISKTGFSSVYECFVPPTFIPDMNFQYAGIRAHDRCTFVAIKDHTCELNTSPAANKLWQEWPEHSLSYASATLSSKPEAFAQEEISRKYAEIINSKAWKFLMVLRRLRIVFVPPGSAREKLARFLLRPFRRYSQKEDSKQ
jgi:hypothetical protein